MDVRETTVTLRAKRFLRDAAIFPDRLEPDGRVDDQLITLLPGESHTFELDLGRAVTTDELNAPGVIQCANRFGRRYGRR